MFCWGIMSHEFFVQDRWIIFCEGLTAPTTNAKFFMQNSVCKDTFPWETIPSINVILKGAYDDKKVMKYFFNAWLSVSPFPKKHPSGTSAKFDVLPFPASPYTYDCEERWLGSPVLMMLNLCGGAMDDLENLKNTVDSLCRKHLHPPSWNDIEGHSWTPCWNYFWALGSGLLVESL